MHKEPFCDKDLGEFEFTEVPIHFAQGSDPFPNAYIQVGVNAVGLRLAIDTGHGLGLYRKHTHPEYLTSPNWTRVKLSSPSAGLVLPVQLEGGDETFRFCLDTGAAYVDEENRFYDLICSQSLLGELLEQRKAIEPYSADAQVLGKFGTDRFRTLCGYPLAQLDFVVVDLEHLKIDGLLGHSFFTKHSVFIDFGTDNVYLGLCDDAG